MDNLIYEGTYGVRKLITRETPHQILSEDYPNHWWPISGGWGYTQREAVVLEVDSSADGAALEYKFLQYRTFEEAIVFRPKGERLAGFRFENGSQAMIIGEDGKTYDKISMIASAFKEDDFDFLKNDYETHNGYENDPEGYEKHMKLAESKKIKYEVEAWFDISRFI